MRFKSLVLVSVVSSFILSGCESRPSMLGVDDRVVVIESPMLSHLPDSTKIDVSLIRSDGSVQHDGIDAINYFPYHYEIPVIEGEPVTSVSISVSVDADKVLVGENKQFSAANRQLVLQAVKGVSLRNTYWKAEDLSGRGIPPTVETTLAFNNENLLSGNAGCNLYRSVYSSASVFIEIDKPILTRRRCSSPVMYHENRYLVLLTSAERFSIDEEGDLSIYVAEREKPLKFSPLTYQDARLSMDLK
ncbi:META domain-containing protein [Neptuniibacter pectenicola]|uniref:META domain-containing protein n=1 Tax=Neptuniibacter pectenicola TaxID=1806669 RepID=UPI0009ED1FD7|nr:META domain-containing protein [Neptuniibacter pectenicola]